MNIFLLNIIIILIYALFCNKAYMVDVTGKKIYNRKHLCGLLIISVVLILELGLKGDFAIDTRNYHYIFNYCKNTSFLKNPYIEGEWLFEIINFVVYYLSGSFLIFLFLIAILTVASYIRFVYKESNIMWLSILILLCSGNFYSSLNLMRNVLAASVFTLAIRFIYEENIKRYVIFIVLLSMVHTSAIFLLPLYFLSKVSWRRLSMSVVVVGTIILGIVLFIFAKEIINVATLIAYEEYLAEDAWGMGNGNSLLSTFKAMVYSGGVLLNKKHFYFDNKRDMTIFNGCMLHFIVAICGARIEMIQRFHFYFIPFVMLAYPLIISRIPKHKKRRQVLLSLIVLFVLSGVSGILGYEYYFFWENSYISW